jgi:hypothetical protein
MLVPGERKRFPGLLVGRILFLFGIQYSVYRAIIYILSKV